MVDRTSCKNFDKLLAGYKASHPGKEKYFPYKKMWTAYP
jgi:hypothetical protein